MGGFEFDLCKRNAFLEERGVKPPLLTKTGTTIAGVIYKVWQGSERPPFSSVGRFGIDEAASCLAKERAILTAPKGTIDMAFVLTSLSGGDCGSSV